MLHNKIQSLDDLETCVDKWVQSKDFAQALSSMQLLVEVFLSHSGNDAAIFGEPRLDALCQKIGLEIYKHKGLTEVACQREEDTVVYIATELYHSGGHTAVLEDFILLQPNKRHIILITHLYQVSPMKKIEARFAHLPVTLVWAPSLSLTDKVLWLFDQIQTYRPNRIFLLNHHQDCVAIAALQPEIHPEVFFYHHADHNLCLGVHVPHFLHIDPHPMGYHNCRNNLGIENNIYWPLIVVDQGVRPTEIPFLKHGKLKTCSSGSAPKFEDPYLYQYANLVPKLIERTKGLHLHIGPLSPSTLESINERIIQRGLSPDQFIHFPWVKSVWQTLIDEQVDLYIASFPHGGGKVSIEAMGSGTPVAVHSHYKSQFLGGECLVYPEGFCWRKPEQLLTYVENLTASSLKDQSVCARLHYERYHQPQILEKELQKTTLDSIGLPPPSLPCFQKDDFQIALEASLTYDTIHKKLIERESIKQSLSWRLTAPLRQLKRLFYG